MHKTGYNWYSKMPKTNIHCTTRRVAQGHLGTQGQIWLGAHESLGGPGHSPQEKFKIWGPRNGQILHSGSLLTVISMTIFYLILYFGPPLTKAPGKIAPFDSTYSFNYLWRHSFIITYLQERNIFVLANERQLRQLRTDKPLEEFQGHAPTENFVI
jgi:hypothetical protein